MGSCGVSDSSLWRNLNFPKMNIELQCFLSTLALLGVQFTWTVELSYGTPFLVSLGLSKESTALVWLAGPIAGLVVQPLVGYWSDRSSTSIGRRRPFILGGTAVVIFSIFLISFCETMGAALANVTHLESSKNIQIAFAVIGFCKCISLDILDFSINTVQASCRILIVDVIPYEHQSTVNAVPLTKLVGRKNDWGRKCIWVLYRLPGFAKNVSVPWFYTAESSMCIC